MRNDIFDKLVYWLIDPAHTDRDLALLQRAAESGRLIQVMKEASRLRVRVQSGDSRIRSGQHGDHLSADSVIDEVERLLLIEGQMSSKEAMAALRRSLGYRVPASKRGFREELERLERDHGGSLLLNVALRIRNAGGPTGRSDWPLPEDDQ